MKEPLNIEKTDGGPSAHGRLGFADGIFPTTARMIFLRKSKCRNWRRLIELKNDDTS
jgi:hypothetical protein